MTTIILEQEYLEPGIMISDAQKLLFPASFLSGTPLNIRIEYDYDGEVGRVQEPFTATGSLANRHPENAEYWVLYIEPDPLFYQQPGNYIIFENGVPPFWTNLINTTQT